MASLARWCFRHRYIVISFWAVLLIVIGGINQKIGSRYSNTFSLPNTDSTKALNLLSSFPSTGQTGDVDTIVWHVKSGSVLTNPIPQEIGSMLAKIEVMPQVASISTPYSPQGILQISKNQQTAYAQINFSKESQDLNKKEIKNIINVAQSVDSSNLEVELGGQAIENTEQNSASSSEGIGILAAAIILLIAFGSFTAMSIPIIVAIVSLGISISSISLISHWLSVSTFSPTLGALIGLGVSIDYALFIVTRYRTGLLNGLNPEEATVKSLNTAGRAVIFAGGTVCVALLGLLTLGISFLDGVGVASAAVVLISVLVAITLLPAILGIYKSKVLSRRTRRKLKKSGPIVEADISNFWSRNAKFVERNSSFVIIVALTVMVILIIPFFSMRLGSSDASNDPSDTTTRKAYTLLAEGFGPGFNGPLQLVATLSNNAQRTDFVVLGKSLKNMPGVAQVSAIPLTSESKLGLIEVIPSSSPESKATSNLITTLRESVIPKAESKSNLHVYVGGLTAIFNDFATVISSKLPLFLVVVIGLGFIILMVAFRSLLIPLTAAAMNLLAAGAAFGVVVAVFQWGWVSTILHTGGAGPIESFLPVIMLAILFGLSMDYQVFLVSRMHEEWVHTKNNHQSVRIGQTGTGRVITAAATIMILVFLSFILGGERVIEEFGIGLSSAVLLDAFILRNFLVPALMHRFGKANWWLPKWLDRILPHLAVEPVNDD